MAQVEAKLLQMHFQLKGGGGGWWVCSQFVIPFVAFLIESTLGQMPRAKSWKMALFFQ